MGQTASKGLSKAAEKAAKQASSLKRPPIPKRLPDESPGNPGFLRGGGLAEHDVRDKGQEMYLQHVQEQRQAAANPKGDASVKNTEMPEDLLKFITDVGPATKSVDREFTTSRLLKEENKEELNKLEISRTAKRERIRMPLMQGEDQFATEKNTNFTVGDAKSLSAEQHDFGLSNIQLYEFLAQKDTKEGEKIVDDVHEKIVSDSEDCIADYSSPKGEELKKNELELLAQTLKVLEIPTLRLNEDGDILGLSKKDVPGPEMKSITTIPEDKIIMVLKDLSINPR